MIYYMFYASILIRKGQTIDQLLGLLNSEMILYQFIEKEENQTLIHFTDNFKIQLLQDPIEDAYLCCTSEASIVKIPIFLSENGLTIEMIEELVVSIIYH